MKVFIITTQFSKYLIVNLWKIDSGYNKTLKIYIQCILKKNVIFILLFSQMKQNFISECLETEEIFAYTLEYLVAYFI